MQFLETLVSIKYTAILWDKAQSILENVTDGLKSMVSKLGYQH